MSLSYPTTCFYAAEAAALCVCLCFYDRWQPPLRLKNYTYCTLGCQPDTGTGSYTCHIIIHVLFIWNITIIHTGTLRHPQINNRAIFHFSHEIFFLCYCLPLMLKTQPGSLGLTSSLELHEAPDYSNASAGQPNTSGVLCYIFESLWYL